MNLYLHWNLRELKTKSTFIHWREDRCLLLKASVNGCNSHWKYTSVVHTGKSWVSTVEHRVWGYCSRLDSLLSTRAASDWPLYRVGNTAVFISQLCHSNCYIKCLCVRILLHRDPRSLNEGIHRKITLIPANSLDDMRQDWRSKQMTGNEHVETLTALSIAHWKQHWQYLLTLYFANWTECY